VSGVPKLDERLDLEPVRGEHPDPVSVAEVEVDPRVGLPFEPAHPEVRAEELGSGGDDRVDVGRGQHEQRPIDQEDELAPRAKEPCRLRNPEIGIAPDARPVLGHGEVERRVRERHVLGARVDERELEAVLRLHRASGVELLRCQVDADRTGALPREPRGYVCGAAAQLDHVLPRDVRKDLHLALWDVEDAPGDLLGRPVALRPGDVARRLLRPLLAVDRGVRRQVFRHRQISSIGQERAHLVSASVR
jgi:hypothetical protein